MRRYVLLATAIAMLSAAHPRCPGTEPKASPWKSHVVRQLNGPTGQIEIPSQFQIVTERWNRVVAVPYLVYMPERDRLLMLVCGDVDELFDHLVAAGVNCFNPFQPEVMNVGSLMMKYRGRLAFHGGLSSQKTLPFATVAGVRDETNRLLNLGREGGYIFAPAHDVDHDVPLENMLVMMETLYEQEDYATLNR
jgi:hypothetical protein